MNFTLRPSLVLLFCFGMMAFSFSQVNKNNQLTEPTSEDRVGILYPDNISDPLSVREFQMIKEVFAESTETLVLKNSKFLKDIKHLLRNRIKILEIAEASKQKKNNIDIADSLE